MSGPDREKVQKPVSAAGSAATADFGAAAQPPAPEVGLPPVSAADVFPGLGKHDDAPTRINAGAGAGEAPGTRIGRYKLLQPIGEGGFGSVFVAEQEQPVRRTVAVKILKLGMDTRQIVARFEQERQALAMMDHPNIAKVLDAGATETGRPYFVMELVRGVPITQYCDEHKVPTQGRLELFASVCHAIQHAHQKGIIHRDIKPSNVLVSLHDDVPMVKVIDFGIAKATGGRLTEKTVFTEMRQMIGTPAYMSPEQTGASALDVDTRSDVYGLGVLMYELLTGTTPFAQQTLASADFGELQRLIREVEPPKPSTRISTMKETLPAVAANRAADPARLSKLVRGELDWIVMKAIEKDRARRYESASDLAADVQRHLRGEAVLAAPPSTAYVVRKFVRRNRGPVIAGAVVSVALVLGVIGTSVGLVRARQAQRNEVQQRLAAERQRDKAEKIAGFMGETLSGASPSVARGRDTTMLREMMDAAAKKIASGELKDNPEAELALRLTIGQILSDVAAFDAAEQMLAPAVELSRSIKAGDSDETVSVVSAVANLRATRGEFDSADKLFRDALAMAQRLHPGDHRDVAIALRNIGGLLLRRGDTECETWFRQSLEMQRRLYKGDHPDTAESLSALGVILLDTGREAEAEPMFRESLAMLQRLHPADDHPDVAVLMNNLADTLQKTKRFAEAEPMLRESVEIQRRVYKADNPLLASTINNLARCLANSGNWKDAEPFFKESLQMRQRLFAAAGDHPELAESMNNEGVALAQLGHYDESEKLHRQALEMRKRIFGPKHAVVGESLYNLSMLLESKGDAQGAAEARRECETIRGK